jgi:hypothetical protein
VPDRYILGLSDVTNSTRAIGEGRYKAVNLAGAAVISAVMNALAPLGVREFDMPATSDRVWRAVQDANTDR